MLQENFLFRGTVRENIIAGRAGLTLDDAVRAAAGRGGGIHRAHAAGLRTWIEEGSPNSGGQRQRLAIARALISDPQLMILDEATSALDPESEALVNANLLRIARGRTMVIVSHRLSSLTECDLILVMDKGRVIDVAPHRMWWSAARSIASSGCSRPATWTLRDPAMPDQRDARPRRLSARGAKRRCRPPCWNFSRRVPRSSRHRCRWPRVGRSGSLPAWSSR